MRHRYSNLLSVMSEYMLSVLLVIGWGSTGHQLVVLDLLLFFTIMFTMKSTDLGLLAVILAANESLMHW